MHAELLSKFVEPVGGHIWFQLSPPALLAVHADVADRRLLLNDLQLPRELLNVPLFILRKLRVHRDRSPAHRVRTLCRHLTVVLLVIRTIWSFICRLALIREICLLSSGRVAIATCLRSLVRVSQLASLIMHELLGYVVDRARAVLASEIITVKLTLHTGGSIGSVTSSTCAALSCNSV